MNHIRPQTARDLKAFFDEVCEKWDSEPKNKRGNLVNPDEPVVLMCKNPHYEGSECPEDEYFFFHIKSDIDEGECLWQSGVQMEGFEVRYDFYENGHYYEKSKAEVK